MFLSFFVNSYGVRAFSFWFYHPARWFSAAAQFSLLTAIAFILPLTDDTPPQVRMFLALCTLCLVLVSFFAWLTVLRRYQSIARTPVSRIASAAQGYVALCGKGKALEGPALKNNWLWYKIVTTQRVTHGCETTVEESDHSLLLDDHGTLCLVDIESAVMETSNKYVENGPEIWQTSYFFERGETLYAMGDFSTTHNLDVQINEREEIGDVLIRWKQNPAQLLRRFDLDNSGTIDEMQWALARQAAKRQAAKERAERLSTPALNMLKAPEDGQLYLITNRNPQVLLKQYLLWICFHLTLFFGALAALVCILFR